jgi:zinc D-Ala-D-Ala carboxypeptidase
MKNRKRYLLPIFFGIGMTAFLMFFNIRKIAVYAQETLNSAVRQTPQSNTNETESPKLIAKTASVSSRAFTKSAVENSKNKYNLKWIFGGKTQTGWQIYIPLIQKEIETQNAPETTEFAVKLGEWQTKNNLSPSGILDQETLETLTKLWQSRRLNSSLYPSDEQLFSAPIADFYDPTRSVELLKLERETYSAYKRMLAAAIADKTLNLKTTNRGELAPEEKFLRIVSAFRSREYQEKLRLASPNSGSAGLAKNSPHFTGRALDIYVGGEPVTTKDWNREVQVKTPVYQWLVKNAHRFGFYPYFYEPWHWEYVGVTKVKD